MGSTPTAAICVPARNEAALLPRLLAALSRQIEAPPFVLCLLLDECTDASEAVVRSHVAQLPYRILISRAASAEPNAGLARRRAMALGLSMLTDKQAMIVSTDADSVPDDTWLAATSSALRVADVAAGRITRCGGRHCATQDRMESYYDALFALRRSIDPVPWEASHTHHYTSAASLAFRVGAYRSLGGFPPIAAGEDGHIVDAAHRAGLRVRRDAAIRVATSGRRNGRATGGLAQHLRQLDSSLVDPNVAHPDDVAWRYKRQAAARAAWTDVNAAGAMLAALFQCERAHIDRVAADVRNAEGFATRVVPDIPGGERMVPLRTAEAALARLSAPVEALAA